MIDYHPYLESHLDETLALLQRMVTVNSFTVNGPGVTRVGEILAQALTGALPMQAEFVPSTVANFGKHLFVSNHPQDFPGPTIALITHLDTVFPPEEEAANNFHWQPDGERIYGPGTVDIKGGSALIWLALSAMHACNPALFQRVRWLVCADASEETLSEDFARQVIARLPAERTLACLVFEGGAPAAQRWPLAVSRKGRASYRVTAQGRGAHAGNHHHKGANAIVQLAHAIVKIASFTDYARQLTFTPGVVRGGSVVNRVPHEAELLVEMRCFDPQVFEEGLQKMRDLNDSHDVTSQDDFAATLKVELGDRTLPWPYNPATQKLYRIWQAAGQRLGMQTEEEYRGGLSDANYLWRLFPTLDGLGPCGDNAHCSERSPDNSKQPEYVLSGSFVPKALLSLEAITSLVEG